jgi:nitrate reductase NapD
MNISSVIVDVQAAALDAVSSSLRDWPDVQLHHRSADGKLVVTIETDTDAQTTDTFGRIGALDGVMSVSLVYHQFEPDPDMEVLRDSDAS